MQLDAVAPAAKTRDMARLALAFALTGLAPVCACFRDAGGAPTTSSATTGPDATGSGSSEAAPTTEDATTGTTAAASTSDTGDATTTTTTTSDATSGTTGEGLPPCGYDVQPVTGLVGEQLVARDFSLDGRLDIAAQPASGAVQLFHGDGTGLVFTPGDLQDVGAGGKMAGGDFDGDGTPDLVHYDFSFTDEVGVQLNFNGLLSPLIPTSVQAIFYTARVADVDADGDSDFSYGGSHAEPVHVLLSDKGQFSDVHQLNVTACYATASTWADLDADGDLDFAVIGDCNQPIGMPYIAVHLRQGDTYLPIAEAGRTLSADTLVLEAGDFDGDGLVDLVTQGHRDVWAFERHLGLGTGKFAAREEFPLPPGTWIVRALDADGDGLRDLLTHGPDGVALQRSTGPAFTTCAVGPGQVVTVADFDGDAVLDVLLREGDNFSLAKTPVTTD